MPEVIYQGESMRLVDVLVGGQVQTVFELVGTDAMGNDSWTCPSNAISMDLQYMALKSLAGTLARRVNELEAKVEELEESDATN